MKIYALAFLLVCCVIENASADWRYNARIKYCEQINTMVDYALARIRRDVNAKGIPAAERCYEDAKLKLTNTTQTATRDVTACINVTNIEGYEKDCVQKVGFQVFETVLVISRTADECLKNA